MKRSALVLLSLLSSAVLFTAAVPTAAGAGDVSSPPKKEKEQETPQERVKTAHDHDVPRIKPREETKPSKPLPHPDEIKNLRKKDAGESRNQDERTNVGKEKSKDRDQDKDGGKGNNKGEDKAQTHATGVALSPMSPAVRFSLPLPFQLSAFLSAASTPTPVAPTPTPVASNGTAALAPFTRSIGLRALVLSADGNEPTLSAITGSLEQIGAPYDVILAGPTPLTESTLVSGNGQGKYNAVFLTTSNLAYFDGTSWLSALDTAEWDLLAQYELDYGVREINAYTYPTSSFGLGVPTAISIMDAPLVARLTPAGRVIFPYLVDEVPIRYAYTYLAPAIDPDTVPLITAPDGSALVSVRTFADGRQAIVMTMDGQGVLLHSILVGYGLVDWGTRGVFIGERAVYSIPQIDDFFLANALWEVQAQTTNQDLTYRVTVADWRVLMAWQAALQQSPLFRQFVSQMVFNGAGANASKDPLTQAAVADKSRVRWVNHTWDHENMNAMSYTDASSEVKRNNTLAAKLKLTGYSSAALVTPEISGLSNPEAVRAMVDAGVRYTVGDTSRPPLSNPSFNLGVVSPLNPGLYIIPRFPTNIYYNVTTPAEAMSEFNHLYRSYYGRDLTYAEMLDLESDRLLGYMVSHNQNPLMFHQSNLRAYDGAHSLYSDTIDAVLAKYARYYNLPVLSPTEQAIGKRMQERAAWQAAGVSATWTPGVGLAVSASATVPVPVSGIRFGTRVDQYATETISWIGTNPAAPVLIPAD